MVNAVVIDEKDNVAVAIEPLKKAQRPISGSKMEKKNHWRLRRISRFIINLPSAIFHRPSRL